MKWASFTCYDLHGFILGFITAGIDEAVRGNSWKLALTPGELANSQRKWNTGAPNLPVVS